MITSFLCKDTEKLFSGRYTRRFRAIRIQAERKLTMIDAAATIEFLNSPPGNRLERLRGDRTGQWSVRINAQWRICFKYADGNASDVEIVDYH
jgi:proteic killer suppression protein